MSQLSLRNNRLKFKTPRKLPFILEEFYRIYPNFLKENQRVSMCKRLVNNQALNRLYPRISGAQEQKDIANTNEVQAALEITTRFENQQETRIKTHKDTYNENKTNVPSYPTTKSSLYLTSISHFQCNQHARQDMNFNPYKNKMKSPVK